MKIKQVYRLGEILDIKDYSDLQELDKTVFINCENEFKHNRDWWVIKRGNKIIAYCGSAYKDGICIFVRAWVDKKLRGRGLQKLMIKRRLLWAKKMHCKKVVTYTVVNNYASINSLISCGFKILNPVYKYAGKDVLYWLKEIK